MSSAVALWFLRPLQYITKVKQQLSKSLEFLTSSTEFNLEPSNLSLPQEAYLFSLTSAKLFLLYRASNQIWRLLGNGKFLI